MESITDTTYAVLLTTAQLDVLLGLVNDRRHAMALYEDDHRSRMADELECVLADALIELVKQRRP